MTHLAIQHPTTITPDMEDNTMETEVGIAQKTGLDHKLYEDRYRILDARAPLVRKADRGIIYGVMDGVGGAPRGMGAAQELCDQLQRFFRPGECEPTTAAIRQIIHDANDEVASWGCIPGTDRPLGAAAATVAWFAPDHRLHLFHVGDTTAYRWDGLNLITLTSEQGSGRALYNYVGLGEHFHVQQIGVEFEEGDTLLLVSDGVTKVCALDHLADTLEANPRVETAAQRIVDLASHLGSRDDITAMVVELCEW